FHEFVAQDEGEEAPFVAEVVVHPFLVHPGGSSDAFHGCAVGAELREEDLFRLPELGRPVTEVAMDIDDPVSLRRGITGSDVVVIAVRLLRYPDLGWKLRCDRERRR